MRETYVRELEKSDINLFFLTFLIDKRNGISPLNYYEGSFTSNVEQFYEDYNIPKVFENNDWSYFDFFNNKYYRNRTIDHAHQTRQYGCYHGIDDRLNCPDSDLCVDGPNTEKKHKCKISKGNVWVKEGGRSNYRLSSNYISVIKKEFLNEKKVDLSLLLNYLYEDVDTKERFINDFNITNDELFAFFNEQENVGTEIDSTEEKTPGILESRNEEDKGQKILIFLKKEMNIF